MAVRVFYDAFHVAAAHQLRDHVRLVLFLAQVEDGDDVGMGTQPPHGLGFTLYAFTGGVIQPFGLDKGEGDFPVQQCILRQIDFFLASFSQESLYLVAVVGKGGRLG